MSETRALTAALSGPVFDGAASRTAQHASDRHVDRWAPEGEGARRSAGMRSLAFADQVASPWMSAASYSRMSRTFAGHATGASSARAVPTVSWLFPRPWYQDELDWMAAARQGLESSPSRGSMTTRGTFMNPGGGESAWSGIAMPVLSADVMASVSPSMSDGASMGSPMGALRAWSPNVDFAAAAAAEVVAGTMRTVADAGLPGIAGRSPIWSGLSVVTPHALASSHASAASYAGPSYATTSSAAYAPSTSYATTSSASPSTSSYLPTAMGVAPTAGESAAVESARLSLARIETRLEQLRAPSTSSAAEAGASTPSTSSEAAPSPVALSAGESNLAGAAQASPSASGALRTVELLLAAVAARSGASSSSSAAAASSGGFASASAPSSAAADSASSGGFASDGASAPLAAASVASNFAPSAGPRVAMPAGLGGLVQSLAARQSVARPMAQVRDTGGEFAPMAASAALSGAAALAGMAAEGIAPGTRAPVAGPSGFSPVWAAPATGALASLSASPARAIDHLSWSDRWLARFSGASPLAMSAYDSASEAGAPALRPLAVGSPEVVYVHPQLAPSSISALAARSQAVEPISERALRSAPAMPTVTPARAAEAPRGALRLDDSESVPDSVFAAIAAAAAAPVRRDAPIGPSPVTPRSSSVDASSTTSARTAAPSLTDVPGATAPVDLLGVGRRLSIADLLAVSAPTAPDAGLAPSLASSPMAPALAAVLPLPTAPVFDPRALQGSALTSAYLGGLVARSAAPVGVLTGAPTLAALARAGADAPSSDESSAWMQRDLALAPTALRLASAVPQTDFVVMRDARGRAIEPGRAVEPGRASTAETSRGAIAAPPSSTDARDATSSLSPSISSRADIAAAIEAGAPADVIARMVESRGLETELLALRSAMLAAPTAASVPLAHAAHAPLVSASVPVPTAAPGASTEFSPSLAPAGGVVHGVASPLAAAQARTSAAAFADAMTVAHGGLGHGGLAGLGAPASHHAASLATAGGRPGSLAEAALAWSVAEERSAANLSFDFVTPEMVLAAKVYGLPPGAAAEAVRLAASGPASMASMATQLDLTLLRAFQSSATGAPAGAFAAGAPSTAAISRSVDPVRAAELPRAADASVSSASAQLDAAQAASPAAPSYGAPSPGAMPGYDAVTGYDPAAIGPGLGLPALSASAARLPRGAFLWPSGAVAALGLRALSPDGAAGLPVAALELLAAQAVADLGTWVTAFPGLAQGIDPAFMPAGAAGAMTHVVQGAAGPMTFATAGGPASSGTAASSPSAMPGTSWSEPAQLEADAVEASSSMAVPTSVRSRFESVYVALARSSEGQSLSPAARAARAMALLTSSTPGLSTRDAAAASWSMLPSVYTGGLDMVAPGAFAADAPAGTPDLRPGLAGLAARAGESIGSFVTPSAAEVAGVGRHADGAARTSASASSSSARAAEPVYVDTASRGTDRSSPFSSPRPGRTFTQYGGGEPEIPSWFESAAQRMFASSGDDRGGMSLAQMVLVTAMPQQQVAAATRGGGSSGGTGSPGGGGGKQGAVDKPDVDKLALEVFQEVLHLLEIARQRSGDPFQ